MEQEFTHQDGVAYDYRGRAIKMGDRLVYPVRRRSKLYLRECKVMYTYIDPTDKQPRISGVCIDSNRRVCIKVLKNVLVLPR